MGCKFLLFLLFAFVTIFPQNSSNNISAEFQIGINLFQSYQNDDALQVFTRIAEKDFNQRTTAALLFEGKINLLKSSEQEALTAFGRLFVEYPLSIYIDEAHMSLTEYYLDKFMYAKSLRQLCLL